MLQWDDLRIFLAIYRHQQLTAAGRTLGADQSTVGRRLAALEGRLDAKLFARTRDGLLPTPAAERLAARAQRMEEEAFAIDRESAGEEERLTGSVRITAPDGFAAKVLASLLAKLTRVYPQIEVELVADNRIVSLSKREADIALRVGSRPRESGVVTRKLTEYASGLYASRDYVKRRGLPKPDYRKHDCIAYELDSPPYGDVRWMAEHAKSARVAFRANTNWAILAATHEGLGFSLLPTFLVRDETGLVEARAPRDTLVFPVWLVLHKDLQQAARVRACADFLAAELGRMTPQLMGDSARSRQKGSL